MDYGLGGASSFIAAASGASVIQATSADSANEPATPLEETVLGLLTLYGNDVGIHTESLTPLARLVAELSDVPQPSNRPVSCARGFDVESGIITSWVRNVRDIVDRSHALPPRAGRADRSQPSLAEKRLLDQDDLRAIVDTVRSA